MRRLRPSPAMTVALIALFVSLGGTGYAALKLPRNSVGPRQLQANSVTSTKVKQGSLALSDIRSSARTGLRGPEGPRGAQGPQGPSGTSKIVMRKGSTGFAAANDFGTADASCKAGERATGGGAIPANRFYLRVSGSYPLPNPVAAPSTGDGLTPTGWRVFVVNENTTTGFDFEAYVICASP